MKSLAEIAAVQQASRPAHTDALTDRLLAELLRAMEEVCVLRDRLDTAERLADGTEKQAEQINSFDVDELLQTQRLARHSAYYEEVFARLNTAS